MTTTNKSILIVTGLLFLGLLYILAPILTPFLLGALLAYLINPLVIPLSRKLRVSRTICISFVFLVLFLLIVLCIVLLIPLIQEQIDNLVNMVPNIITWLHKSLIPTIANYLGTPEQINANTIKSSLAKNLSGAGNVAGFFATTLFNSGVLVIESVIGLFIIPIVAFYMLCDWNALFAGIQKSLPRTIEPTVVKLTKQSDDVLRAFFRGQLLVCVCIGIYYAIGLSVIGLSIGILLGILIGIATIVPYLGVIVGIITATIAGLVQFDNFNSVIYIWVLFGIGQLIESLILTPKLMSDRIGLHPVVVIFAILAGEKLFGFFGILLAIPVAAVLMVCLRFLNKRYHESTLYR